jgi:hypothetical protein
LTTGEHAQIGTYALVALAAQIAGYGVTTLERIR